MPPQLLQFISSASKPLRKGASKAGHNQRVFAAINAGLQLGVALRRRQGLSVHPTPIMISTALVPRTDLSGPIPRLAH